MCTRPSLAFFCVSCLQSIATVIWYFVWMCLSRFYRIIRVFFLLASSCCKFAHIAHTGLMKVRRATSYWYVEEFLKLQKKSSGWQWKENPKKSLDGKDLISIFFAAMLSQKTNKDLDHLQIFHLPDSCLSYFISRIFLAHGSVPKYFRLFFLKQNVIQFGYIVACT